MDLSHSLTHSQTISISLSLSATPLSHVLSLSIILWVSLSKENDSPTKEKWKKKNWGEGWKFFLETKINRYKRILEKRISIKREWNVQCVLLQSILLERERVLSEICYRQGLRKHTSPETGHAVNKAVCPFVWGCKFIFVFILCYLYICDIFKIWKKRIDFWKNNWFYFGPLSIMEGF